MLVVCVWSRCGRDSGALPVDSSRHGRCLKATVLRPLEKMVVRFGEGAEVVRQEIVGRRDPQEREAGRLAQQTATAGPLAAAAAAHRRQAYITATDAV